ncbi:MAG: RDD family protein [bacterium]
MKVCALCQEEITPQMVRRGTVISRGVQHFHRECRRGGRPAPEILDEEELHETGGIEADLDLSEGGKKEAEFGPIRVVKYASAGRRFASHLIDGFILNVVLIVPSFGAGLLAGVIAGFVGEERALLAVMLAGWAIGFAIPLAYVVFFWTKKDGATPGKMVLGIRVVSLDGGPITTKQSMVRCFGYIPSGVVFGLGYLAMLWDAEKRCWHDRMANTRVIRI